MPDILASWKHSNLQAVSLRNYVYDQVAPETQLRPQALTEAFDALTEALILKLGLE